MIRSFNYTGRQRINQSDIAISVSAGNPARFDANVDLTHVTLPGTARVFVEAYRGATAYMRFDYGTVAGITPPTERALAQISDVKRVLFRVKVVDPVGPRLLAVADRLRPTFAEQDDESSSRVILDPVFDDIGDLIWKVDFEYAEEPVLKINNRLFPSKIKGVVKSDPSFAGLVFPAVLRDILTHVLFELVGDEDSDDLPPWIEDWYRFVDTLGIAKLSDDPEDEERRNYIDQAVGRLATKIDAAERYSKVLETGP